VRFILGGVLTLLQMLVVGAVGALYQDLHKIQDKLETLSAISEIQRRQDRDIERIFNILERERRGVTRNGSGNG
jgi:hypothetical protein